MISIVQCWTTKVQARFTSVEGHNLMKRHRNGIDLSHLTINTLTTSVLSTISSYGTRTRKLRGLQNKLYLERKVTICLPWSQSATKIVTSAYWQSRLSRLANLRNRITSFTSKRNSTNMTKSLKTNSIPCSANRNRLVEASTESN